MSWLNWSLSAFFVTVCVVNIDPDTGKNKLPI